MTYKDCWYNSVCSKYNTRECSSMCIRYTEMLNMMKYSGIPKNLYGTQSLYLPNVDIEAYKTLLNIKDNIKDFVQNGNNLYIYSKVTGNGKTTWGIKLLQSYFNSVWLGNGLRLRGFFIPTQAFLLDKKNAFSGNTSEDSKLFSVTDSFGHNLLTTKNLINCDIIVWDDFLLNNISPYDYANIFAIIDQRYLNGKTNIFTAGGSLAELDSVYGSCISSRIAMNCTVVEFKSIDYRAMTLKRNAEGQGAGLNG